MARRKSSKDKELKSESSQNEPVPEDISESSSSEEEDENANLVTEDIDQGIKQVLETIRNHPEDLKDKSRNFFPEIGRESDAPIAQDTAHKPMYLGDYQREMLLDGSNEENYQPVSGSYSANQENQRSELLKAAKEQEQSQDRDNNKEDDDDDDDDFLQKRESTRQVEPLDLPNPDKDADGFLNAYLDNRGWISKPQESSTYKEVVGGDEDSDSFDDLNEKFESAYNFRFEDPNSAEIVSYARDQNTLRRSKDSSRKRARERKRELKEAEEQQNKLELSKLRKGKIGEITSKLEQLQNVADLGGGITEADLEGDWNDNEWDQRMQQLFNDDYYAQEDAEWNQDATADQELPTKKLSKRELKRKAEEIVDSNTDLLLDEAYKPTTNFRYREVEPESFGLTTRDILLADDKQLNKYVGLKKLASFRDADKVSKDRQRYSKKKKLKEWRRDVFGTASEPGNEHWERIWKEAQQEHGSQPKHQSKKRRKTNS